MAHSQVYDLPTNVRTSGCPSLHGNFDVRAVMATHRNKQTDSRRFFLFWRHLIEKKSDSESLAHNITTFSSAAHNRAGTDDVMTSI